VRSIGVSNFSAEHLQRLLSAAQVVPAVNQVELNPFFNQQSLRNEHKKLGIVTEAWSPIGGVYDRNPAAAPNTAHSPLQHPAIVELANKYGKTPAQIVLRWHLEHGIVSIPKSVRPQRIAENIDIFGFSLTPDEVGAIDALGTSVRAGSDPEVVNASTFPIAIKEDA
jgi:diketogulonate reductase-like aldo/keto reductase